MLIKASSIDPKYINLYSLHDKTIVIPIFQRFYDWKEKQVDALLEDLLNCKDDFSKEIYLMDLAYYKENEQIILADGQQRIVTINLLIKVINDYVETNNLDIERVDGFNILYDKFNIKTNIILVSPIIPSPHLRKTIYIFTNGSKKTRSILEIL